MNRPGISFSSCSGASLVMAHSTTTSAVVGVVPLADRMELLKWLGFATMIWDHTRYLGGAPGWEVIGRAALPFFALAFGWALSVVPDARALAWRLWIAGVLAELLGAWTVSIDPRVNVLFLFALCATLEHSRRAARTQWRYLLTWLWVLPALNFVEYGIAGLALVMVSGWAFSQEKRTWRHNLVVLATSVLLLMPNNSFLGSLWTAVGLASLALPIGLPRWRRAFLVGYVAQWPVWKVLV